MIPRPLLILFFALAAPLAAAQLEQTPMPLTGNPDGDGDPLWISAEYLEQNAEALYAKGEKGERLRERIARELEVAEDGKCHRSVTHRPRFSSDPTLPEAMTNASFILLGAITGVSQGFSTGTCLTQYRYEPVEFLRGALLTQKDHFFWSRQVDFMLEGRRICRQESALPPAPELGDQVLILRTYPAGRPIAPNLVEHLGTLQENELVVLKADGRVLLPRMYQVAHPAWQEAEAASFLHWLRGLEGNIQ